MLILSAAGLQIRPSGDLFAESHRLEAGIREKLAGIGFNVK